MITKLGSVTNLCDGCADITKRKRLLYVNEYEHQIKFTINKRDGGQWSLSLSLSRGIYNVCFCAIEKDGQTVELDMAEDLIYGLFEIPRCCGGTILIPYGLVYDQDEDEHDPLHEVADRLQLAKDIENYEYEDTYYDPMNLALVFEDAAGEWLPMCSCK